MRTTGAKLTVVVTIGTVVTVVVVNCPPRADEMFKIDPGILLAAKKVQADILGITWLAGM